MKRFLKIALFGTFILIILLAMDAGASDCEKKSNMGDLKKLGEHLKPKANSLVSLSVEKPWVMVQQHEKVYYDFNGKLPSSR